jgi:hypothetical protein
MKKPIAYPHGQVLIFISKESLFYLNEAGKDHLAEFFG